MGSKQSEMRMAGNWEGKPLPGGTLGAGNTQEEAPQRRDFPSHSIMDRSRAMHSHPPSPLSHLPQQTCAVCLEDFKVKEELGVLPCQHAFHRR